MKHTTQAKTPPRLRIAKLTVRQLTSAAGGENGVIHSQKALLDLGGPAASQILPDLGSRVP